MTVLQALRWRCLPASLRWCGSRHLGLLREPGERLGRRGRCGADRRPSMAAKTEGCKRPCVGHVGTCGWTLPALAGKSPHLCPLLLKLYWDLPDWGAPVSFTSTEQIDFSPPGGSRLHAVPCPCASRDVCEFPVHSHFFRIPRTLAKKMRHVKMHGESRALLNLAAYP